MFLLIVRVSYVSSHSLQTFGFHSDVDAHLGCFYSQSAAESEGRGKGGKLRRLDEGGGLIADDLQDADKVSRDAEITRLLGNHLRPPSCTSPSHDTAAAAGGVQPAPISHYSQQHNNRTVPPSDVI
ncbi:hypothetical protein J6590_038501 [Homalodisca vitripennis]|nr:hypothetical protein J6590_038501 [Homalodisca vitripennis]